MKKGYKMHGADDRECTEWFQVNRSHLQEFLPVQAVSDVQYVHHQLNGQSKDISFSFSEKKKRADKMTKR